MTRKQLTDAELDALIVRSLSRLPAYGPSRFMAANVMNRVQLPAPRAVRVWQRTRSWLAQPRRVLAFAGVYAAAATIALVIAVPWLVTHSPAIGFAYDWTIARFAGVLRDAAMALASWTVSSGLAGLFKSVRWSGSSAFMVAFAGTVAYAGCAIGLHYLLRTPREKQHAPIQIPS